MLSMGEAILQSPATVAATSHQNATGRATMSLESGHSFRCVAADWKAIVDFFVVVACPNTGREVPTGIVTDSMSFANLPKGDAQFSCPACGQSHKWTRSDARLAHSLASLDNNPLSEFRRQEHPRPTSNVVPMPVRDRSRRMPSQRT